MNLIIKKAITAWCLSVVIIFSFVCQPCYATLGYNQETGMLVGVKKIFQNDAVPIYNRNKPAGLPRAKRSQTNPIIFVFADPITVLPPSVRELINIKISEKTGIDRAADTPVDWSLISWAELPMEVMTDPQEITNFAASTGAYFLRYPVGPVVNARNENAPNENASGANASGANARGANARGRGYSGIGAPLLVRNGSELRDLERNRYYRNPQMQAAFNICQRYGLRMDVFWVASSATNPVFIDRDFPELFEGIYIKGHIVGRVSETFGVNSIPLNTQKLRGFTHPSMLSDEQLRDLAFPDGTLVIPETYWERREIRLTQDRASRARLRDWNRAKEPYRRGVIERVNQRNAELLTSLKALYEQQNIENQAQLQTGEITRAQFETNAAEIRRNKTAGINQLKLMLAQGKQNILSMARRSFNERRGRFGAEGERVFDGFNELMDEQINSQFPNGINMFT